MIICVFFSFRFKMAATGLTREQSFKAFDGYQYVYNHERQMANSIDTFDMINVCCSETVGCKMKFGVYVPQKAEKEKVPLLIFLSGLSEK